MMMVARRNVFRCHPNLKGHVRYHFNPGVRLPVTHPDHLNAGVPARPPTSGSDVRFRSLPRLRAQSFLAQPKI